MKRDELMKDEKEHEIGELNQRFDWAKYFGSGKKPNQRTKPKSWLSKVFWHWERTSMFKWTEWLTKNRNEEKMRWCKVGRYTFRARTTPDKAVAKMRGNKAGYTATEVASGWAGAIFEVTRPFWHLTCWLNACCSLSYNFQANDSDSDSTNRIPILVCLCFS